MNLTVKTIIQKGEPGYMAFTPIPQEVVDKISKKGNKRVICTFSNGFEIHCAIQRMKGDIFYIGMGKRTLSGAKLALGEEIKIRLKPDDTPYQSKMPQELGEVLKSDFEGDEKFHQLSPGKQRSIIYMVSTVKSSEKRIERALKIIENIKMGITDNRELLR